MLSAVPLPWLADKQRREWCSINGSHLHAKKKEKSQCTESIYHISFVDFAIVGIQHMRRNQMLSQELLLLWGFLSFLKSLFFFLQCHLPNIKLMSIGNNSACQWGSGLRRPGRGTASYLSSAKVSIDWSADCASVSPPVQPFLRPPLPAPSPLPPSLPSIHPSSIPAQGLIDQLCPGSCPQITQLDVFCVWVKWINYRANRTGDHRARKSPWMQQRDGKEEGQRTADVKQMVERREWGWFEGNKRDVFRWIFRIVSSIGRSVSKTWV